MQVFEPSLVAAKLKAFTGADVYAHMEVTPGGFARNMRIFLEEAYIHGDGPYRVTFRLPEQGWIRVEGLTHFTVDESGRLLMAGHDETGRLTTGLELSRYPFE